MVKGARVSVPGAFGFFAGNGRSALSVLGYAFCGLCFDPAPSYQAPGFSFSASQEMLSPPHFPRAVTFYLMVAHFLASGMEAARHAVEVQLFRFARNDFAYPKRFAPHRVCGTAQLVDALPLNMSRARSLNVLCVLQDEQNVSQVGWPDSGWRPWLTF